MAKRNKYKEYYIQASKEEKLERYSYVRKEDLIPDKMILIKKK